MTKRIVIISDTQFPFENRRFTKAVVRFIGDVQPDEVVHIGDLMDYPQPSRWSKGTRSEFEGSVFEDSDDAKRRFLEPLRAAYSGPVRVHEGNHDARPREYLDKYAPALSGTDSFDLATLLDFDGFGIEMLPEFHDIAPGWISTHGHRGGIRLTTAGNTALNAAKRFGKSVVMGHTHRLVLGSFTLGYGAEGHTLTGFEVGNLTDMSQAQYLKGATANWQSGFGILDVDGPRVTPIPVPVSRKGFIVDGRTWTI